jgi:hypothetical protein
MVDLTQFGGHPVYSPTGIPEGSTARALVDCRTSVIDPLQSDGGFHRPSGGPMEALSRSFGFQSSEWAEYLDQKAPRASVWVQGLGSIT